MSDPKLEEMARVWVEKFYDSLESHTEIAASLATLLEQARSEGAEAEREQMLEWLDYTLSLLEAPEMSSDDAKRELAKNVRAELEKVSE